MCHIQQIRSKKSFLVPYLGHILPKGLRSAVFSGGAIDLRNGVLCRDMLHGIAELVSEAVKAHIYSRFLFSA